MSFQQLNNILPLHIVKDSKTDTSSSIVRFGLPLYSLIADPNIFPAGSMMYNTKNNLVYFSDGKQWNSLALNESSIDFGTLTTGDINLMANIVMNTINITNVEGDLYLFPRDITAVTGPFNVAGNIIVGNSGNAGLVVTAQIDLGSAYQQAKSIPGGLSIPADINLLILGPGVYKTNNLTNSGIATLDAGGNPNAIWIFQINGNLSVGNGSSLNLINGAQVQNVIWQISGACIFGTGSSFKGIVMSTNSIFFDGGNTFQGRALVRNGNITFAGAISNINLP